MNVLNSMTAELEASIDELRGDPRRFEIDRKACVGCGTPKPLETKKCRKCSSETFQPLYCDAGSRVCDFIGALETAGTWPLSGHARQSASGLLSRLKLSLVHASHRCDGQVICPLISRSKLLVGRLESLLESVSFVDYMPSRFEGAM